MFQLLLALLSHGTKKNINMLRVFFYSWKPRGQQRCCAKLEAKGERGDLEEGTVGALSPQALRARFVLAVSLVDLQVLHLQRGRNLFRL